MQGCPQSPPRRGRRRLAAALALAWLAVPVASTGAALAANGGPDIDVFVTSGPLPAKARTILFLVVENDGPGLIRNVTALARPTPGAGLLVLGDSEEDLDDIAPHDDEVLALLVATGDFSGGAGLAVTLTFTDQDGVPRTVVREVNIQIAPPLSDPLLVEYVPRPLEGGGDDVLLFLVSNPSSRPFVNLDLDLVIPTTTLGASLVGSGSPFATTGTNIAPGGFGTPILRGGTVLPGETIVVEAEVRTALQSEDLLIFSVAASYTLEGFERSQRFDFGARVEGSVRFRLLDAREETVGDRVELTGILVNVGTGTAWNPRVGVPEGGRYRATEPVLVEDLKPNEPVAFRIPVTLAPAQTNETDALIEVEWNDERGLVQVTPVHGTAREIVQESTTLASRIWRILTSPAALTLLTIALLLVLAALGRAIFRRYRERADAE